MKEVPDHPLRETPVDVTVKTGHSYNRFLNLDGTVPFGNAGWHHMTQSSSTLELHFEDTDDFVLLQIFHCQEHPDLRQRVEGVQRFLIPL